MLAHVIHHPFVIVGVKLLGEKVNLQRIRRILPGVTQDGNFLIVTNDPVLRPQPEPIAQVTQPWEILKLRAVLNRQQLIQQHLLMDNFTDQFFLG